MELNERQKKVLFCVVNEYIKTKKPVSSERVIESTNISHSSATVRNDLRKLEYLDYVKHIHTSSGRVPTDKGYRFYVDSIFEISQDIKTSKDMEIFPNYPQGNFDQVINRVSTLLVRTVPVMIIITKPVSDRIKIKAIKIHRTFEDYITVVLFTELGMIKNQTIPKRLTDENVREIERILNTAIVGRTIDEIRANIIGSRFEEDRWHGTNVESTIEILKNLIEDSGEDKYIIRGIENLIDDESIDQNVLRNLLSTLETPNKFYKFLEDYGKVEDIKIFIGSEHPQPNMESFASFIVPYKVFNEEIGYVISIGTKSIDYQRIIKLTWYIGNRLTELLTFLSRINETKR
ncbi:MAG: heat-inducible transcription repressor HrcA [Mesoaciditoga sp.]|uniref:heat-inducible transcriptional repressor HrcA n=1 Tax=Athalassotoga sp. TaxID=2022597 RepID=UPI000CBA033B|nr:MAG: heat-inducible transcription repressor HrcA [Mesoaciditoga sp.]HEU23548.1 heat-inducible transcription repressor HrcA [Mesoaciditoga lauensis]